MIGLRLVPCRLFSIVDGTDSNSNLKFHRRNYARNGVRICIQFDAYPLPETITVQHPRCNVYRMVLEDARAKLGRDSDALASTRGRQEVHMGLQGIVPDSHGSNFEGTSGDGGEGRAEQSLSPL